MTIFQAHVVKDVEVNGRPIPQTCLLFLTPNAASAYTKVRVFKGKLVTIDVPTIMVLTALLFSISSCIDNLVVGTAYGVNKIKIGFWSNLMIAVVTTTGTFLSMSVGWYITKFLSPGIANDIGSGIMILLGLYFVLQSVIKLLKQTKSKSVALKDLLDMVEYAADSDRDKSGDINLKEAFLVALGLTLNNIGAGIAASISGVSITLTVISTFLISLLTIVLGGALGSHVLGKFFGKFAPLIAGSLLLVLGIFEWFS